MLSFSSTASSASAQKAAPIKTFDKPRFEGDSGIYPRTYPFYQGCKPMTIDGVRYIRDCYGNLKLRQ
jgi:hypothetical protein